MSLWLLFIASILFYYSVWQKNNFVYAILGILTAILYVVYNILYFSPVGAISQTVLAIMSLVGLITNIIKHKKQLKLNKSKGEI